MRPIDEKIIAMRLDNKDFEANARQSLSTMDRIKAAFSRNKGADVNFDGAAKGAHGLGSAVDGVTQKFSALKVMGVTALATITSRAVDAGLSMARNFTLKPIMDGFNEYQLKMKSIQTIQANTKKDGTKMSEITTTLDELNHYADKTIYNFAEMTRNIGTFTAAGVKLQPAAKSIKGIANLAALSGSTSQQASVAMYQLSQAISAGSVKLQDWNSVVNAGMGGTTFQEALKRTARAHGIAVDDMIKKHGSFRESLSEGWITANVLTDTLEQLTMSTEGVTKATVDSYKAQLKKKGYNDQQIKDILELATVAEESATKVRTFEQLFDAMGESIGSKWSDFWEMLVGDFGEATDRLTAISSVFEKAMDKTFNAFLANMKKFKDMGGIKNLWKGFSNIFRNFKEVFSAIGEGLKHFIPPVTVKQMYKLSEAFVELTEKARVPKPILEGITKTLSTMGDIFQNVFGKVTGGLKSFLKLVQSAFQKLSFQKVMNSFKGFANSIGSFVKGNAILNNAFNRMKSTITGIASSLGQLLERFFGIKTAFASSGEGVDSFARSYKSLGDSLKDGSIWEAAKNGIQTFGKKLKDLGKNLLEFLKGDMKFSDVVKELFEGFDGPELDIFGGFKSLKDDLHGLADLAREAKRSVTELFNWDDFKVLANLSLIAMEVVALKNIINTIKTLTERASLITPNVKAFADGWKTFTGAFKQNMKAQSMKSIALGLVAFAGALFILSQIDPDRLMGSLVAAASGLAMLAVTLKMLEKIKFSPKDAFSFSASVIGLSVSIVALSYALNKLSEIDIEKLMPILTMVTLFMLSLKATAKSINADVVAGIAKMSGLALALAASMLILSFALRGFSELTGDDVLKGLGTFGALIAGMAALTAISKGANLAGMSGAILSLSFSMMALYLPIRLYSRMEWSELAKGIGTIAALGLAIGAFARISNGNLAGAGFALLAFAIGINALIKPIKTFGEMDLKSLAQGLLALFGAFAVVAGGVALVGAVAAALKPVEFSLLSLGKTILVFSASVALFGAGILALVTAAKMLTTVGPGIIAGFGKLIEGVAIAIREAVPIIAEALIMMLIDSLKVLDENIEQFVDILTRVLVKVFNKLAEHAEEITQACINLIKAIGRCLAMAFDQLSVGDLFLAIMSVYAITKVAKAVQGLKELMPGALKGIALAGILIAEVGAVLAAIGLLRKIPGVAEVMDSGVEFLIDIGRAVGGFIGGIVGGVAEGATKGLPRVAENLSGFAENIKPFIDMSKDVPSDLAVKMEGISLAMKNIAGASIGNAIANFIDKIGGGGSTELFVSELNALGRGLKQFSNETAGINIENVSLCVQAVDKLVEINDSLPALGGIAQFFTGNKSFETFASGIKSLGKAIRQFANEMAGIDIAAVDAGVRAGDKLAELQNSLPKLYGLVQLVTGQGDIGTFGENIARFGKGIKRFSDSVVGIDIQAIADGVRAGEELSKLQSTLGSTGGLLTLFTGTSDLGTFGATIYNFGMGIRRFSDAVAGLDMTSIRMALQAVEDLNDVSISNISGLEQNTGGLVAFGRRMKELGKNLTGFPVDTCRQAGSAIKKLSDDVKGLANINVGNITALSNALGQVGDKSINKIQNSFRNAQGQTESVIRGFLNRLASTIRSTGGTQLYTAGTQITNKFVQGIRSRTGAVSSASSALGAAARSGVSRVNLYGYGANAGAGFANGLRGQYGRVYSAAANLAWAASNAVRRNLSIHSPSRVMYGLGDFTVAGFVNAMLDGVDSAKEAGTSLVDGTIDGIKSLASDFASLVDDEFTAHPEIKPVVNWDEFDPSAPDSSTNVYGQNGGILLGTNDQSLAMNVMPGITSTATTAGGSVIKNYHIDNRGMLDGAIFQVREESDIHKVAKELNRLENEELYRKGIVT